MRIAYVAPYQGPGLLKTRPVLANLSLAGSIKTELIAGLLKENNHEVEIISQGEVVESHCKWYPSLEEPMPSHPEIPIFYASALPIRFLNGLWSSQHTLDLFKSRHQRSPYDLIIIYNLNVPQLRIADYAIRRLGIPVILEYEDDAFVDLSGQPMTQYGIMNSLLAPLASDLVPEFSGCIAASTHLLSQLPSRIPQLLLRGVVGRDIIETSERVREGGKKNWVFFSGTFHKVKGIEQLLRAWQMLDLQDWELHITGDGGLAELLHQIAKNSRRVVFHGLVERCELVSLMCSAKICINPHDLSQTLGNVFSFKIIEYLAAGAHVISTPMGYLEGEIEQGMTYMVDNKVDTIAATLNEVIVKSEWLRTAPEHVFSRYGYHNVGKALHLFTEQVMQSRRLREKLTSTVT